MCDSFGTILKRFLDDKNISSKRLAVDSKLSTSTISKFITGEQEPRFSQILQITKALGISPVDFFSTINTPDRYDIFINDLALMRPIFHDVNAQLMAHSVYAFKRFMVEDSRSILDPHSVYLLVVHSGKIIPDNIPPIRAGNYRVISKSSFDAKRLIVEPGTHHTVIHIIKKGTLDLVAEVKKRFENIIPANP